MADKSDVEQMLASMAAAAVYPNGTSNPHASVAGVTVTVARGWPEPGTKQLDGIIAAGNAMVTVYSAPGMGANTTRFLQEMSPQTSVPAAQLTLTVASNQITVGGTIKAGEAACANVNYQAYSYGVQASDTLATVATSLAAKIPGATASGAVITIANVFEIEATVSVPVLMQQEVGRQTQVFMIIAWCPLPPMRDTIINAIDKVFMLDVNKRILLPDNTLARLIYRGTTSLDHLAKQNIYRRDTRYEVEYVTTSTEIDNTVTNLAVGIAPAGGVTSTINI